MTQIPYPPPPPPPPSASDQGGFHGPRTNFFLGIRVQLASLEQPLLFRSGWRPNRGLVIALIISAVLGFLVAFFVQLALLPIVGWGAMTIVMAPLTEEPSKALAMLIVAVFVWKVVPNRRYGAVLGAAAGLGFGVVESILYLFNIAASGLPSELLVIRILITPLMHPLWSAFVGIGVFAIMAKRQASGDVSKTSLTLPLLFLLVGMANHMVWNAIATIPDAGYWSIAVDAIIIFPIFAIILRDFLGGRFNFQRFFESSPEQSRYPITAPPPPPSPPVPICPSCGQSLRFVQQYQRWYCARENKYV